MSKLFYHSRCLEKLNRLLFYEKFYESDQLEFDRPNQDSSLMLYVSVNTWIVISAVISIIGRFMWSFLGKKVHDLDWNINKKKFNILEKKLHIMDKIYHLISGMIWSISDFDDAIPENICMMS